MIKMEKLGIDTKNLILENIQKIEKLFPDCITEVEINGTVKKSVNFEMLKQELGIQDTSNERYQFTWPGKNKAKILANSPTNKSLRPSIDNSVEFNETKNIYIEGDNLDVLKILRETYLGKIKMVYIDPPYNTGSDFVYKDSFSITKKEYSDLTDYDQNGNRLEINTVSNGNYHTMWLNMIYPRIKLAKDLLSEEGIIFISIGKDEVANLKKICDEIFGERNFISQISWVSKSGGSADEKYVINAVEYILVYARDISYARLGKQQTDTDTEKYKLSDQYESTRGRYVLKKLDFRMTSKHYTESLNYPIQDPDGNPLWPGGGKERQDGGWNWRWSKDKVSWGFKNGFLEFTKGKTGWVLNSKQYQNVDNNGNPVDRSICFRNYILPDEYNTTQGSKSIVNYFGSKEFEYAKPVGLIKHLMRIADIKNSDIVLDFFSGSATTAEALFEYNIEKNCTTRFILIQLPEKIEIQESSKFDNICELGKARIKLAGQRLKTDNPDADYGFRVLKLSEPIYREVYVNPENISQTNLDVLVDNIDPNCTSYDILFQVMLQLGIDLSSKITTEKLNEKTIFKVKDGYLVACFDENISEEVVMHMAQINEPTVPAYAIFRDACMSSDEIASNYAQIFKTYGPGIDVKTI